MRQTKAPSSAITPEQVEDLTQAVVSLTEQVRVLRQAVDEIGDELEWAIRNRVVMVKPIEFPQPRITSFPVDPLAEDFHERVNAVTAADLPPDADSIPASSTPRKQALFW